ncbi:SCAN domain-containing protein 3 [Acipenser ruthenus]|uniref:SCAN domain-containing protein 3 n=1 Tax=Acipenser ruthenus TaxID=7906 RepID=A0A444UBS6_ACIRT|nr:SCAN domain-containing protein 3 [Acipenser ruthenus]
MPMVIDALRQRDGVRWRAWQRGHRPRSLEEDVELVLCYLEADMERTTAQMDLVKTVNYLRAQALNHRLFREFLSHYDAEYNDIILHSEICWLSRGRVLERFGIF